MTTSTLSTEEAIVALKQHVEEFIVLELNNRLEEQIQQLVKQGALDLSDWDGVHLEIPRLVTTALMEAAGQRVIWRSCDARYRSRINKLKHRL